VEGFRNSSNSATNERPHKVTDWGHRVLRHIARKSWQCSAGSIAEEDQTSTGIILSQKLYGMSWTLRARPARPTSVPDLTNALLDEWA